MATANTGQYTVSTEEKYERDAWRSEFFVDAADADSGGALFREGDFTPPFDSPESAAIATLRRGVEFAQSLGEPQVIGLLTLYS